MNISGLLHKAYKLLLIEKIRMFDSTVASGTCAWCSNEAVAVNPAVIARSQEFTNRCSAIGSALELHTHTHQVGSLLLSDHRKEARLAGLGKSSASTVCVTSHTKGCIYMEIEDQAFGFGGQLGGMPHTMPRY